MQSRNIVLAISDPPGKVRPSASWNLKRIREAAYSSFQHAVVRSINDKNAQLQKQLENLVREGIVLLDTD